MAERVNCGHNMLSVGIAHTGAVLSLVPEWRGLRLRGFGLSAKGSKPLQRIPAHLNLHKKHKRLLCETLFLRGSLMLSLTPTGAAMTGRLSELQCYVGSSHTVSVPRFLGRAGRIGLGRLEVVLFILSMHSIVSRSSAQTLRSFEGYRF